MTEEETMKRLKVALADEVCGPLRYSAGPHDAEGNGRERYWELTQEQRCAALPTVIADAETGDAQSKAFARGWLSELNRHARARGYRSLVSERCPRCGRRDAAAGPNEPLPTEPHRCLMADQVEWLGRRVERLEERLEEKLDATAFACEEGCDDVSHAHCVPLCRSSKQCPGCESARDRWYNR